MWRRTICFGIMSDDGGLIWGSNMWLPGIKSFALNKRECISLELLDLNDLCYMQMYTTELLTNCHHNFRQSACHRQLKIVYLCRPALETTKPSVKPSPSLQSPVFNVHTHNGGQELILNRSRTLLSSPGIRVGNRLFIPSNTFQSNPVKYYRQKQELNESL